MSNEIKAIIAAVIAGLYFLWKREKGKRKDAEVKNLTDNVEDAYVKHKATLDVLTAQEQSKLAILEVEKGKRLSVEEMEKFLDDL